MDMFVIACALLASATGINAWVCTCWPRKGRDMLLALFGSAATAVYLVLNKPYEIAIIWTVVQHHGLTVADLFAIPCVLFSSLLMGRTILLAGRNVPARPAVPGTPPNLAEAPASAPETAEQPVAVLND